MVNDLALKILASHIFGSLLFLLGCTETTPAIIPSDTVLSYDIPLADFSDAATKLVSLSSGDIAIGEIHGSLNGIMFLEAVVEAAKNKHETVLILHEFTPEEINLDLAKTPMNELGIFYPTDLTLPFWTHNPDRRASYELHRYFSKIAQQDAVELSYLWDARLNPPPNFLKAHGFAERWKVARLARPHAFIVSLSGNYHTSEHYDNALVDTNSLCRYAEEALAMDIMCVTMERRERPHDVCQAGQKALLRKGEGEFSDWDYAVLRPDGCSAKAHWTNAKWGRQNDYGP